MGVNGIQESVNLGYNVSQEQLMSHLIYEFEWNPEKARINRKDHGIDFEEAESER